MHPCSSSPPPKRPRPSGFPAAAAANNNNNKNNDNSSDSEDSLADFPDRQDLRRRTPAAFRHSAFARLIFRKGEAKTPLFTHQTFPPDGHAFGYSSLKVTLRYSHQLRVLAEQTWTEKLADADPLGDPLARLQSTDVVAKCGSNGFTANAEEFARWVKMEEAEDANDFNQLPGRIVWQQQQQDGKVDDCTIRWCDSLVHVRDLVGRCQALGFWQIETAEFVNHLDENFALLYSTTASDYKNVTDITGYLLLYKFRTLREKQPYTWKICQIVTVPAFESRGLGRALIQCVHREAGPDVYEAGVEDPCDMYQRLRLLIDAIACEKQNIFFGLDLRILESMANAKTGRLPSEIIDKARGELKIVAGQIQQCFELAWRQTLQPSQNVEAMTKFRQTVKKRLYYDHEEELDRESPNFKDDLEQLFQEQDVRYQETLGKLFFGN